MHEVAPAHFQVALLHVSCSLSANVTCATARLICHNIYVFSSVWMPFFFFPLLPLETLLPQQPDCSATAVGSHREMRGEYRDVKLHYGSYSAAGSPRYPPAHPTLQLRMRPALLMSRHGGTQRGNKRLCATRPRDPRLPPEP